MSSRLNVKELMSIELFLNHKQNKQTSKQTLILEAGEEWEDTFI